MRIDMVSSGAKAHLNEDWAGSFQVPGRTDLVIIDGGTSVADRDYVDPVNGDVVWFVTRFASALGASIAGGLDQDVAVHAAAETTYAAYRELGGAQNAPQYAWPIAAMTWVRITNEGGAFRLNLYCLGDCKVLLLGAGGAVRDLDPFVNPQEGVLRAEIAKLQAEGVCDSAARHIRLLPILRARRAFQNTVANPATLCLRPNGAFHARCIEARALAGDSFLAMTNGFYRLVDIYGLHTPETLAEMCTGRGLQAALDELRSYEAQAQAAAAAADSVKRADDASAILWQSA